jgi:mannose-1-phosphate guanylyltransferase
VGWGSKIGAYCRLEGLCLLGEDVTIKDEVFLHETIVCPNKSVGDSNFDKGKIIL